MVASSIRPCWTAAGRVEKTLLTPRAEDAVRFQFESSRSQPADAIIAAAVATLELKGEKPAG